MIWFKTSLISNMVLRIECRAVLLSLIGVCLTASCVLDDRLAPYRLASIGRPEHKQARFQFWWLEVLDSIPGGYRIFFIWEETCSLLGYYAARRGNIVPTFWETLSVTSSGIQSCEGRINDMSFWNMTPYRSLETYQRYEWPCCFHLYSTLKTEAQNAT
jgi:hypothetical protein